MVRPMVHSVKHYVQQSISPILAGAKLDFVIISSVAVVDKNIPNEVTEGSSIKAVYCEFWVRSSEASPGSIISVLYKNPGGGTVFTTVQLAQLQDAENKKNILFSQQGLVNDSNSNAIATYRGWVKIPKSKQRFGLGDRLIWTVFAQGAIDILQCGLTTYKEYT